jgi:preprotein translocase subunit SecA
MITKSIERAQRKVEENNFGIRKRLLEYDDVMNKQRTVIYTKRSHALFGERLALDLDNGFYSVAEGLISSFREQEDFEGFRMAVIVNFGIDTSITQEELTKTNEKQLAERLYTEAITHYQDKKAEIATNALPVFKNIRQQQGQHIENVVVPFTDGRRGMQVLANLDKTLKSDGYELTQALERNVALGLIDDAWKEHLRAMDDLKQSVQTASYEQKDPLVIYKMEAFGLFKKLDEQVNRDIVSFLCHAGIPVEQEQPAERIIHEARQQKTDMSRMSINKDEIDARGDDYAANENDYFDPGTAAVKQQPIVVGPKTGRNDPCPCGSGKKFKQCHGKDL